MINLATLLLPLAIDVVRSYINNSDSKKDDKVLEIVQEGCYYLAPKKNNNLRIETADKVSSHKMTWGQK